MSRLHVAWLGGLTTLALFAQGSVNAQSSAGGITAAFGVPKAIDAETAGMTGPAAWPMACRNSRWCAVP